MGRNGKLLAASQPTTQREHTDGLKRGSAAHPSRGGGLPVSPRVSACAGKSGPPSRDSRSLGTVPSAKFALASCPAGNSETFFKSLRFALADEPSAGNDVQTFIKLDRGHFGIGAPAASLESAGSRGRSPHQDGFHSGPAPTARNPLAQAIGLGIQRLTKPSGLKGYPALSGQTKSGWHLPQAGGLGCPGSSTWPPASARRLP